jgi:hypothetical protein
LSKEKTDNIEFIEQTKSFLPLLLEKDEDSRKKLFGIEYKQNRLVRKIIIKFGKSNMPVCSLM